MAWDKTQPAAGEKARFISGILRTNNAGLELAVNDEHIFNGTTAATQTGLHRQGSARCFFQDAAPATRIDTTAFTADDLGSLWFDSNSAIDNQFNVLTNHNPVTWTPISTEVIATLLAAERTFAEAITFSKAPVIGKPPTFTEGAAANDSYIQGRNAADDGNVNLIKANASDKAVLSDGAQLAAATEAADTDRTIADKKYVDDQKAATMTPAVYAGEESVTYNNGMIFKCGSSGSIGGGATVDITYAVAFNTFKSANVVVIEDGGLINEAFSCKAKTGEETTKLSITNKGSVAHAYYWQAWGY